MKRERKEAYAESRGTTGLAPALPLPRKAAASIRGLPSGVRGKDLPGEFVRAIKKILQNTGSDAVADYAKVYSPLQKRLAAEPKADSLLGELAQVRRVLEVITDNNPTFSATVPIVLKRLGTRKLELIASGVLVRIVNRSFLLTAAHVTDRQNEGCLLIPGKGGFVPANGYFASMRLPASGRRVDDKLDVAYCRLDSDCVNDLHPDCTVLERR